MRIVLDTGIFVSALITKGTPPDMLYQSWRKGAFGLVTSEAQLKEIEQVFAYKKLERFINSEEARFLLDGLYQLAFIAQELPSVDLSPDPDDNKIIATAIAGSADYLVSGDKADLLSLGSVEDIPVVTARQMIEVLDKRLSSVN